MLKNFKHKVYVSKAYHTSSFWRKCPFLTKNNLSSEDLKNAQMSSFLALGRAVAAAPQTPQMGGAHTAKRGPKLS